MSHFFLYIFIIFITLKSADLSADFIVSRWIQCPKLSQQSMKFVGISVKECVDECSKRSSCRSVIFSYSLNLCEVHLEDVTPDEDAGVGGSCSFITRNDMQMTEVRTIVFLYWVLCRYWHKSACRKVRDKFDGP
jgi:hypothetical protein